MNKRQLVLIIGIVGVAIVAVSIYFFQRESSVSVSNTIFKQVLPEILPPPSPVPFAEMTIPYLRSRKYESELGEMQRISANASFTSYLTSYDSDGLKINGLLTQPAGQPPAGGWPAIVFIHGYIPPTLYHTQEKYVDYVNYLARNGFVVFKIDLRGHDKSEGEPGGAYYSADYVIDALNARAALQHASFVNPNAIGLWGHSMAGNVTLRAVAAQPNIPAAVIWAGAVYTYQDQRQLGINDNSYRPPSTSSVSQKKRQELFAAHGQFAPESEFWKQVAPTNYLSDVKTAIQLNHAIDDSVVNIGYSRGLNEILNTTTIPHELHEYPQGGHNITGAAFSQAMRHTVEFFKKYLTTSN